MRYNGLNIKRILEQKGIKARDLARKLGKSEQTIPHWIKAESITTNTLIQLATALEVPITEFFDDLDPKHQSPGASELDLLRELNGKNNTIIELQQKLITLQEKFTMRGL